MVVNIMIKIGDISTDSIKTKISLCQLILQLNWNEQICERYKPPKLTQE